MSAAMKYLLGVTTLHYDASKCSGCGRCTEVCPRGVFALSKGKAFVTDSDLCMECGACLKNCETKAMNVVAGVGCAVAVINSLKKGGSLSCDCSGNDGDKNCC